MAALLLLLAAISAPLVEAQQVQQQQHKQERQAATKKAEQDRAEAEARRAQRRAEAEMERRQREEEDRREIKEMEAKMDQIVREGDAMRERGERLLQEAEQRRKQQQQQQQANTNANKNMGTIELRANNFDASVRDGSAWLVEFYAPWCGHCKRFAPTYEKVAETLHAQSKADLAKDPAARTVKVAKVDGSADRALASRFNIRAYPTFFLGETSV